MTECWQREVRKLGTVEPESDAWKDLEGRGPWVPERPPRHRRLAAAVVAFATFGAASVLLWQAFEPGGSPAADGDEATSNIPDAIRITCGASHDEVQTSTVRAQPDGVHFLVDNEVNARGILGTMPGAEQDRTWLSEVSDGDDRRRSFVLSNLPPGRILIACTGPGDTLPSQGFGAREPLPVEIVDVDGVWVPGELSCRRSDQLEAFVQAGDPQLNPVAERPQDVLLRALPGALAGDEAGPAGYIGAGFASDSGSYRYRVVRDGSIVALVGDPMPAPHDLQLLRVLACASSKIGLEGEPTAGLLATPYEVPGYARCDPYSADCTGVWVSLGSYASLRGEDPSDYGWSTDPTGGVELCSEPAPHPQGCQPDPDRIPYTLVMTPSDAERFFGQFGCGESERTMCRGIEP